MHHRIHHVVGGPVAFLALSGACLTLTADLEGGWRWYTLITAVAGLALTGSTALAFERDAAKTGLIQRALIVAYWSWIAAVGIHLSDVEGALEYEFLRVSDVKRLADFSPDRSWREED